MLLNFALGTVQQLWSTAFFGATGGHIAGLSGLIVSLFLLTYIQWHLCIRVFGLIADLPDRVAQWLEVPTTGQMHEGRTMDRLKNKRALITSGIGLETARQFLAEGARVTVTGTNPETLEVARRELGEGALS